MVPKYSKKNTESKQTYKIIIMSKKINNIGSSLRIPKVLILITKVLSIISTKLLVVCIAKLFSTPIKHKIPKRELDMNRKSFQEKILIPVISKEIVVYHYGTSSKKILLVHGWSGRGTQLFKIADELLKYGYSILSFDAPAHGKSSGSNTLMPEFIETILELDKKFGPFKAAVGHSLGGMSLLNAVNKGLKLNHLVVIGSGDIVKDIIDNYIKNLELKPKIGVLLQNYFEQKSGLIMNDYSAYRAAQNINIPVLVIHDENDNEVPVKCAVNINKHLKKGTLIVTQNLGHRKILGDAKVIEQIIHFINK